MSHANQFSLLTTRRFLPLFVAINIPGIANFGGPIATTADAGFGFTQGIFQVVDNFTYIRGNHSYKFGGDIQLIDDSRTSTLLQLYTFPSIDAYLAASNGLGNHDENRVLAALVRAEGRR